MILYDILHICLYKVDFVGLISNVKMYTLKFFFIKIRVKNNCEQKNFRNFAARFVKYVTFYLYTTKRLAE